MGRDRERGAWGAEGEKRFRSWEGGGALRAMMGIQSGSQRRGEGGPGGRGGAVGELRVKGEEVEEVRGGSQAQEHGAEGQCIRADVMKIQTLNPTPRPFPPRSHALPHFRSPSQRQLHARMALKLATWTADEGQMSYVDLKRLYESAISADDKWEKGYFEYGR